MKASQKVTVLILAGIFGLSTHSFGQMKHMDHIMVSPDTIKWMDGPPFFMPGMKLAVIEGDPSGTGMYTIRGKFPKKYKIMPHYHPTDEHVTVLKGKFYMGVGDKIDESKASALPEGGYANMMANTHHYAYTKKPCIVQVHGMGPFTITYINPADDPRNKK